MATRKKRKKEKLSFQLIARQSNEKHLIVQFGNRGNTSDSSKSQAENLLLLEIENN